MKCLGLILWMAVLLVAQPAPDRKPAPRGKHADDSFLSGSPFTFEQMLRLAGEDAIPLRRRKEAIQDRGVDFEFTPDRMEKLKAAGAPAEVLDLIKSKAKAPAPPPPPPAPKADGSLAINCAPADCDVSINSQPRGSTKGGKLDIPQLTAGTWVVDLQKSGYIGHQATVMVESNKMASVAVVLEPNRATQEEYGANLFRKSVESIGAGESGRALASVQATGSATIWHTDGNNVRWTLLMRNRLDRALFQVQAGTNMMHEVSFLGSEYTSTKILRGLRNEDALELATSFGLVRDNQLAVLIAKLSDPQCKVLAASPQPRDGDEFAMVAENGTEKIYIGVDTELRPQRFKIVPNTGMGSVTVTFADYQKMDKVSYPKSMQIKAGDRQQGIEIHLDRVFLNPNLTDGDYKIKGKLFTKIQN